MLNCIFVWIGIERVNMTLSEYIKVLQEVEEQHGNLQVVMTQSGYYSEGSFADLFDYPEVQTIKSYYEEVIDGDWSKRKRIPTNNEYVVLGHSHQSY